MGSEFRLGRWRASAVTLVLGLAAALFAASPVLAKPARAAKQPAVTLITIDGQQPGAYFNGVGAISGGGSVARLLIDYPAEQQNQILNYLFGSGGADLQVLKLEIGGDAAQSDGAEPSVERSAGQVDCDSGFDWWLAEQAVARNPHITLMGLQWSGPGWIGKSIWDSADLKYVIDWLNCAKSHGLKIGYLGGWNEHGYVKSWYEQLRAALDANGFRSVRIMAADSFPGVPYRPARTWNVAAAAAADQKFKASLSALGSHDTCGGPTNGYVCEVTPTARKLGLPLWESELGALRSINAPLNLARSINNGFIQAHLTGFMTWPMMAAMSPGLLNSDRGLIIADQPQSGWYRVNPITWAIAQTTQFTAPGWRYASGANGDIGPSGNYDSYLSPDHSNWSLVAENTGNHLDQKIAPQTITVHLTGGLKTSGISVWASNLASPVPAHWFVQRPDVHVSHGTFSYTLQPGYVVSFTSTTGQSHQQAAPPADVPMTLPYTATPDLSNESWGLDTQEGAFVYEPCLGGITGNCLEQQADQTPIFWQKPLFGIPTPYAIVGDPTWSDYTVSSSVLFAGPGGSAGVISRFSQQGNDPKHFDGYEFDLRGNGTWQLLLNASRAVAKVLASGPLAGITPNTWHTISLAATGDQLTASVDGTAVAQVTNSAYATGLAGIESNWTRVQFNGLTVG
jgi:O-glycosyl hydrolase